MDFFGAADGKSPPLPKICHIYPTMMKIGTVIPSLKKIQEYINHVAHSMNPADISNFSTEISKFCYIKKYMYRLHFDTKFLVLLTFLESLKIKKSYNFDDVRKNGYARSS